MTPKLNNNGIKLAQLVETNDSMLFVLTIQYNDDSVAFGVYDYPPDALTFMDTTGFKTLVIDGYVSLYTF